MGKFLRSHKMPKNRNKKNKNNIFSEIKSKQDSKDSVLKLIQQSMRFIVEYSNRGHKCLLFITPVLYKSLKKQAKKSIQNISNNKISIITRNNNNHACVKPLGQRGDIRLLGSHQGRDQRGYSYYLIDKESNHKSKHHYLSLNQ